jgi:hypothetical protein
MSELLQMYARSWQTTPETRVLEVSWQGKDRRGVGTFFDAGEIDRFLGAVTVGGLHDEKAGGGFVHMPDLPRMLQRFLSRDERPLVLVVSVSGPEDLDRQMAGLSETLAAARSGDPKGRGESPYGVFGVLVRAGKVGAWLDRHDPPDWPRLSSVSFSPDGRLRGELRSNSVQEAEAFAATCREDGYSVSMVPRVYRDSQGKDFEATGVAFSKGVLHKPWPA